MADESYKNGLVSYTSRDYESLVKEFFKLVPALTDLWVPEADSDPGVVLGKYIASVADMLGVNLDCAVNELYAPTVTQRKNAEKLFSLIGYNLGYYRAARTEVTFTNNSDGIMEFDFGFNGSNFATLNTYTDITNQSRIITYNILPKTSGYGDNESSSTYRVLTDSLNVFSSTDKVRLKPLESVTRVAIEGQIRSYPISVEDVRKNNYIITLPSQHVDTTAVWVMSKASKGSSDFVETRWVQCDSAADFIEPEPRFAVTFDSYSNARIQVSNYLNQMENYDGNWLVVYWVDCSGVMGCIGQDVLENLLFATTLNGENQVAPSDLGISNLSNTVELPHTYTVTGASPETAKEAYRSSRNYINTWDSLVTLPDYTRFLKREKGVDNGVVIDCQKALEINLQIYRDENLTEDQKSKKYITRQDFPPGDPIFDWGEVLDLGFDPNDPDKFVFSSNFKTYTAMCFAVHNDYLPSNYGEGQTSPVQVKRSTKFTRYKPPALFIDNVIKDYKPLKAMSVDVQFGYLRVFPFYAVGTITPTSAVSSDVAKSLVDKAKEALALHFAPYNYEIGQMPTIMDLVEVIEACDSQIRHFDPGASKTSGIVFYDCDIDYFNPISIARYLEPDNVVRTIRVNPEYIVD